MSLERDYQAGLIKRLKTAWPSDIIMKTDPNYIQGIPDLIILHEGTWAALEVKKSATAPHRPNQDYYVDKLNSMAYASFIFPENEEEILHEIYRSFKSSRQARIFGSEQVSLA